MSFSGLLVRLTQVGEVHDKQNVLTSKKLVFVVTGRVPQPAPAVVPAPAPEPVTPIAPDVPEAPVKAILGGGAACAAREVNKCVDGVMAALPPQVLQTSCTPSPFVPVLNVQLEEHLDNMAPLGDEFTGKLEQDASCKPESLGGLLGTAVPGLFLVRGETETDEEYDARVAAAVKAKNEAELF